MKRIKLIPIVLVVVLVAVVVFYIDFPWVTAKNVVSTYNVNVKSLNINTEMEIKHDGVRIYTIKGNYLKLVEDPLRMYDENDNIVATAGDDFHLVSQDAHLITCGDEEIEMVGKISFFGEQSYDLFVDGEKVAHAKFNRFNTHGRIKDMNGNVMAEYTSPIVFNDYKESLTSYNTFSDEATHMIFASYYSDQRADNQNKKDDKHDNNRKNN